jgi:hypothetical protein
MPSAFARSVLLMVLLASSAGALLAPLVDRHYLHVFEPDAQATVDMTLAFVKGSFIAGQPLPYEYPPYFDAQFYLYALATLLVKACIAVLPVTGASLPTEASIVVFAIRFTNLACTSASTVLAFLLFYRLSSSLLLSTALAMFVPLSPHMLGIDYLRIDHVVLLAFIATLTLSVELLHKKVTVIRWCWHIAYAIVFTTLVLSKMNSVLLAYLPIWVYFSRVKCLGLRASGVPWFMSGLVAASALFMARFLVHEIAQPGFTLEVSLKKLAHLREWSAVLPKDPLLYYNYDLFFPYGTVFLALALFSALVCTYAIAKRNLGQHHLAPLVTLVVLSLFGILSFKYSRGLYLLVPLYLCTIAIAFGQLTKNTRLAAATTAAGLLLTAIALVWPIRDYRSAVQATAARAESLSVTRLQPLTWLQTHVSANARVTTLRHSDWANPPLSETSFDVGYRFLDFPYLNPNALAQYLPPDMRDVIQQTDVILLNSFHSDFYLRMLADKAPTETHRAWSNFFDELRNRFEVKRFEAATDSYGVRWVEIVIVNPAVLIKEPL